ncbi:MAG: response regulator [Candidatus Brocadiae bacterium]|nr:response regulator [Candidatus Brocadiia bacterium]
MGRLREEVVRRRILLVEGDRHNIDRLRDAFTEQGYECEVALELAIARAILAERLMHLLVLNADLCDVEHGELIEGLKSQAPAMALVIYNGTADKSLQRKFRRMGADSYLSKASDLSAAIRSVQKVMTRRR